MTKHKFVVLTNPVEGREDEYNDWYSNRHLDDFLKIPGFVGAQRFRIAADGEEGPAFRYLAIYDIEADDPKTVLDEMTRRAGTEDLAMSDSLAPGFQAFLAEAITPRKTKAGS